jgi:hypothetical protein
LLRCSRRAVFPDDEIDRVLDAMYTTMDDE